MYGDYILVCKNITNEDFTYIFSKEPKFSVNNSQEKKSGLIQLGHKLLNKLNQRGPIAQDLKVFKFASKPEQPGLSSSICLEVIDV